MPTQIVKPRLWTPSIKSGYARHAGESLYPSLWKNCLRGYARLGSGGGNADARDYVSGRVATANGPAVTRAIDPKVGIGINCTEGADRWYVEQGPEHNFTGKPITVFLRLKTVNWADSVLHYLFTARDGSTATAQWMLYKNGDNTLVFSVRTTLNVNVASASVASFTGYHSLIGWWSGISGDDIFLKVGDLPLVSLSTSAAMNDTTSAIHIGRGAGSANNQLNGAVSTAQIWNRLLSPSERELLFRRPLALWELKPLSVAFPSAAAPAGLATYRQVMSVF